MEDIIRKMTHAKVIPVIIINDEKDAEWLACLMHEYGFDCLEVTFRTEAAAGAIKRMKQAYPELTVGAGTILRKEQLDAAAEAGADFCVAPGLNPAVVQYAKEKGMPFIPGVCTPSEIEQAMSLGYAYLKLFPAEVCGGARMLKALSSPYRNISFMPTGGISAENITEYLKLPNVFCAGVSRLANAEETEQRNEEKIRRNCAHMREVLEGII